MVGYESHITVGFYSLILDWHVQKQNCFHGCRFVKSRRNTVLGPVYKMSCYFPSFLSRLSKLWNVLPSSRFPAQYEHLSFRLSYSH